MGKYDEALGDINFRVIHEGDSVYENYSYRGKLNEKMCNYKAALSDYEIALLILNIELSSS